MKLKTILLLLFVFAFVTVPFAQEEAFSWKNLTLDVTTREDVIASFGEPKSDKTDRIIVNGSHPLFSGEMNKKKWRVLKYENVDKLKFVRFGFDPEDKLVYVNFRLEKALTDDAFCDAYETVDFKPGRAGISSETSYYLYGRATGAHIFASLDRGICATAIKKTNNEYSKYARDGSVFVVYFVSPIFRKDEDTDVLK